MDHPRYPGIGVVAQTVSPSWWRLCSGSIVAVLLLLANSLSAQGAAAQGAAAASRLNISIVPNVSIGGVVLGSSNPTKIKAMLGKGTSISPTGDELRQTEKGGLLIVRFYQGKVVEMEVSSPAFAASNGVSVGSAASAVKAAFGAAQSTGDSYFLVGKSTVQGNSVHTYFDLNKSGSKVASIRMGYFPWLTPCYGGPTHVTQDISGNVTWGLRGCPYILDDSIGIPQGSDLTIKAGVVVKGSFAGAGLEVKGGSLVTLGTADSPVVFTSANDQTHGATTTSLTTRPKAGDWGGLNTTGTGVLKLEHTQVYYAGSNAGNRGDGALTIGSGDTQTIVIQDSLFAYSPNWGIDAGDAPANTIIQRTAFFGNLQPLQIGNGMSMGDSNVFNPTGLTPNKENGIFVVSGADIAKNTASVTWLTTRTPIVVQGTGAIEAGSKLTIGPGAIVKFFDTSSRIDINGGALVANGTATKPVVFTSFADDAHGGDTNGNHALSSPQSGDWDGLIASGQGASVQLHYAQVYYGGSNAGNAGDAGLVLTGDKSQLFDIENSVFGYNANWGIDASTAPASPLTKIENTTFFGNDKPLQLGPGINLDNTNAFHGAAPNKANGIFLDSSYNLAQGTVTLSNAEVPYVDDSGLKVEQGATLVLSPGVVIKGVNGGVIEINGGTLTVNGTAAQPVIMTSLSDNKHGIAYSTGNGAAPGDWTGLAIYSSAAATINHLQIFYAGANAGNSTGSALAILIQDTATATIDGSEIAFSSGDGIVNSSTHQVTITNTSIHDNGGFGIDFTGETNDNSVPKSLGTTTQTGVTFGTNKNGDVGYGNQPIPTATPVPTATSTGS